MNKRDWHDLQVYLMLAAAWRRALPHYKKGNKNYPIDATGKDITSSVTNMRAAMRAVPLRPSIKTSEGNKIVGAIRAMYSRKRTSFMVKVGGSKVSALKSQRSYGGSEIRMTVGYMWYRKVYEPFYAFDKLEYENWFVLAADEVRVNVPDVRLFRATAYSFTKDETQEVFIGQSKVGKQQAVIKTTLNAAIEAAINLYQEEINNRIVGEENADGSKTA